MQTDEALKRTIETVEDLSSVVRTMKVLAAVNIRQYEAAVDQLSEGMKLIRKATEMVCWSETTLADQFDSPRLQRIGLIAFGSDQGMCGGFNESICREVESFFQNEETNNTSVARNKPGEIPIIVVGRRLDDRLDSLHYSTIRPVDLPVSVTGITSMLEQLLPVVENWQKNQRLDAVTVCHHHRLTQTQYAPHRQQLLPVHPGDIVTELKKTWPARTLPLVTLPADSFWSSIAREYVFLALFRACAESLASENAARIAAMQAAEKHIQARLQDLHREYQQHRQESITEELLDVTNGYEALRTDL